MPVKDRFPIVRDEDSNHANNECYSTDGCENLPLPMEAHITSHYRLNDGKPGGGLSGRPNMEIPFDCGLSAYLTHVR